MAQTRNEIQRRYRQAHPEKMRYLRARSTAKSFILKKATIEDLDMLLKYVNRRRQELEDKK